MGSNKLNTWSDEVNVVHKLAGDFVVVTANVLALAARVFVEMVLGIEQLLNILSGSIELDPCSVGRERDAIRWDSSGNEPCFYSLNGVVRWSKQSLDFISSIVLAILGR